MKKFKFIIIAITVYVLFSGSVLFYYSTPTNGKEISNYNNSKKALLIVDLQNDCIGESANPKDRYINESEIIDNTNNLIDYAIQNNIEIVYIKQEFSGLLGKFFSKLFADGKLIKDTKGTEIYSGLKQNNINHFSKPKGDAFSNKELDSFLIKNKINEIIIAGIDGEYCVYHTAIGAINRGYEVSIVKNAIGIKNQDRISDIYEKYFESGIKLLSHYDIDDSINDENKTILN